MATIAFSARVHEGLVTADDVGAFGYDVAFGPLPGRRLLADVLN